MPPGGAKVLLNPTGTQTKVADKFHHQFAPPTCPRWIDGLDLSSAVHLPKIAVSAGRYDLADVLATFLLAQALAGLGSGLTHVVSSVAEDLSVAPESVTRQMRRLMSGEHYPSLRYRLAIARACPSVAPIAAAPWSAMYFKPLAKIPDVTSDTFAPYVSSAGLGKCSFWFSLCALRRAMHAGNGRGMLHYARESLDALPDFVANELIRHRAVEFVDLVNRILHALPQVLRDAAPVRVDLLMERVLTPEEVSLISHTIPDPAVSLDWDDARLQIRRAVVSGLGGLLERYTAQRAWNFVEFRPPVSVNW